MLRPEFFDPIYKASLCWYCYLNETDGEEGDLLKIRPMKLSFHLDDETFSLFEPQTRNSGHVQVTTTIIEVLLSINAFREDTFIGRRYPKMEWSVMIS